MDECACEMCAMCEQDPRCHRLLYLVKTWSKARGVNDSSKVWVWLRYLCFLLLSISLIFFFFGFVSLRDPGGRLSSPVELLEKYSVWRYCGSRESDRNGL